MKNLLKRIGRGIAPLVLTGVLAGCAGTNYPPMSELSESEKDSRLTYQDRCALAKANQGWHRGKNESSLNNTTIGASFVMGEENIETCYINRVKVGKQETIVVFSVRKPLADINYVYNLTSKEIEYVTIEKGNLVNLFYSENKKVMDLAKKKVEIYIGREERIEMEKEIFRTEAALKILK